MKKHVKKNRNKKGSVLLTVMCFTIVCMLIASTALSLASYSAKVSNNNVRSTQAEISAQNYLQEYINTYTGTGDDKFAELATIANGHSESNPLTLTASLENNSTGDNISSVSTQATIKIYEITSSNSVVVRAEVNSNGETEVASAVFDGRSQNPYFSTNVIETTEQFTADTLGMASQGDVFFESKDPTNTVYYTNNQSNNKGDIIVLSNYIAGMNTTVTISDTATPKADGTGTEPKASKVRVQGWLFWNQAKMINETVQTPHAGSAPEDGYVFAESGICFAASSSSAQIGKIDVTDPSENRPIDVYSNGNVYFAAIPEKLPV
ncbi:MAG: hypothetical protein ACI4I6_04060 [Hominimerdicola sp.]